MLEEFTIGSLRIRPALVLAPMAGYTDLAYRRIVGELGGAGLFCTELVSCYTIIHAGPKTHVLIATTPDDYPLGMQIFGGEADLMAAGASVLEDYGADMIDINMGCPAPKVTKSGGGAVLMREPERAAEIVRQCVRGVNVPVTVKIRAGWDADSRNAVDFARRMVDEGAQAVTVHGRTRAQGYSGHADWEIIRQVVEAVDVPVIGNGDVVDGPTAAALHAQTGCAGVMIGRAAMGAPWLFREIAAYLRTGAAPAALALEERRELAWRHFTYLVELYGEHTACLHIRRIACSYARGLRGAKEFRRRIVRVESSEEVRARLDEYFDWLTSVLTCASGEIS
jgi:tRNA-dihydrouridine synthase B